VNPTRRLEVIAREVQGLRTYSRQQEVELLDQVAAMVAERRESAVARTGDAELSDTERAERERETSRAQFLASQDEPAAE
jgi:hypothetical protein